MAIFYEIPNAGVQCKWGRHKSRFSTNSWLCYYTTSAKITTIFDFQQLFVLKLVIGAENVDEWTDRETDR